MNRPRVLFVEDANISRRKFVALIKSLDCDVKEASDGEMALLFANSFLPHLILLDLHMPKRNGISVLEILRSDHRFKKTIIVILTGDANMKVVQLAISKGANDYLLKSDTLANLKARLLEHINAIRQQDD